MKIYNIFEYFSYIISINSSIEIMEHDNWDDSAHWY
jgi:hypothetical protein